MKGEHRHDLETNVLAKRLAAIIERWRPYGSTLLGIAVAIVAFFIVSSYMSNASSARQGEAWSEYVTALESPIYSEQVFQESMQLLKKSAEEHAGTPMQQWADITWADGQVWFAARAYTRQRNAAFEALSRAATVYRSLLRTSTDDLLISRAHYGLARVYEMQGDLEKAKEQYSEVRRGFAALAEVRAGQIEGQETGQRIQRTMDWLATAEPPRPPAPSGPGKPGQQPDFSAGDLQMPQAPAGSQPTGPGIDDILSRVLSASESDDENRYDPGDETSPDDADADSREETTPE